MKYEIQEKKTAQIVENNNFKKGQHFQEMYSYHIVIVEIKNDVALVFTGWWAYMELEKLTISKLRNIIQYMLYEGMRKDIKEFVNAAKILEVGEKFNFYEGKKL